MYKAGIDKTTTPAGKGSQIDDLWSTLRNYPVRNHLTDPPPCACLLTLLVLTRISPKG